MRAGFKKQSGLTIVELTLVATALLVTLIAVIEVGRYVYSLQLINDMTRVSARLGVVCQVDDRNDIPDLVVPSYAPDGFTADNLVIDYLDSDGAVVDLSGANAFNSIRFVRARVVDFTYQFTGILGVFAALGVINVPEFESIRPRENLGYIRKIDENSNSTQDIVTDC
ncbi:pilus assembly protein [Vibrio astriarenae]|uniref:Pilus assembly protein n=1 Tax=Vibrio astriarenae TaxID=1481923 RepID=A0A7Z2T4I7_9VIBR|nr:TadE family protein [Vibrio astriarenae]QIA64072.1 pilus assembly protein [Vibrio astriarenae]